MPTRISYNIHATTPGFDKSKLLAHLQKLQPAWILVMDGLQLAKDIKAALPSSNVISRIYPDEETYKTVPPQDWVNRKVAETGGADIWCYTINEAGFSDQLLNWFTTVIEYAATKRLKVVVGNFSVGTPEANDWGKPAATALLQTLAKHRDNAALALHEYACGVITSGLIGGWPDSAGVQPGKSGGRNLAETWPKEPEIDTLTRFHMGRFKFLLDSCKNAGIAPPRLIMTEWGFDDVSDIKAWADRQPQTPPYTTLRGWKSHTNVWNKFYPQWTRQQALFEQLRWADEKLYARAGVEGMMLFCWGHSSDSWLQFDLSDATEFQGYLETYAKEGATLPPVTQPPPIPPVTPPTPPPDNALLQSAINEATIIRDSSIRLLATLNKLKGS